MGSKSPTGPTSPPKAQVKKENEEEIKDFAETAMNELLGWYGYERLELRRWAASRARDTSPEPNSEPKTKDECSWCNKRTREGGAIQHAGSTFCSELCFSQSRRANFKRAKTCDWCRHVRHTVAYVDFQDGATQLQFCSDKCLNQYKMHIFCRETQAHLDLNPHLVNAASSSNLITPDLWLKNCKSRSASPTSDKSVTSNPDNPPKATEKPEQKTQRKSPLPLITIAPTAKLMKPKTAEEKPQKLEKKDLRNTKMNLRKRRTSKCSATVTSQTARNSSTPKAQDLRMCSPSDGSSPASTVGNSTIHSPPHMNQMPPQFSNPIFGMPPPVFMENGPELRHPGMPNMFPPRHFLPRPGMIPQERPRLPPPLNFPHQMGQAPPVTILVPYPVVLPIPLPIPIPIPITSFIQAHCLNKVKTEVKSDDTEGPLDFTMNGEKNKEQNVISEVVPEQSEEKSYVAEQNEVNERLEDDRVDEIPETGNPEQTLPKFKITRLGNKMAKIVTKSREPPESTRPLRKRRRLVEVTVEEDPLIPKTRKIVEV